MTPHSPPGPFTLASYQIVVTEGFHTQVTRDLPSLIPTLVEYLSAELENFCTLAQRTPLAKIDFFPLTRNTFGIFYMILRQQPELVSLVGLQRPIEQYVTMSYYLNLIPTPGKLRRYSLSLIVDKIPEEATLSSKFMCSRLSHELQVNRLQ